MQMISLLACNCNEYILKRWIGLKACFDWLLKLQSFCPIHLCAFTQVICAQYIVIVAGINELKSFFVCAILQWYTTVLVYA